MIPKTMSHSGVSFTVRVATVFLAAHVLSYFHLSEAIAVSVIETRKYADRKRQVLSCPVCNDG
jgi:hypothetical protein